MPPLIPESRDPSAKLLVLYPILFPDVPPIVLALEASLKSHSISE
jgi:hypothetical protein